MIQKQPGIYICQTIRNVSVSKRNPASVFATWLSVEDVSLKIRVVVLYALPNFGRYVSVRQAVGPVATTRGALRFLELQVSQIQKEIKGEIK
jgi:hypothetical protein